MQYLKRNTKYSILAFLIIVFSIIISISTLAKTEVYFSLYDNPQKELIKNINHANTYIDIAMYIFSDDEIVKKIINLRESQCGGFKNPKDILQLPELTNLDWREWEEEGIIISVK